MHLDLSLYRRDSTNSSALRIYKISEILSSRSTGTRQIISKQRRFRFQSSNLVQKRLLGVSSRFVLVDFPQFRSKILHFRSSCFDVSRGEFPSIAPTSDSAGDVTALVNDRSLQRDGCRELSASTRDVERMIERTFDFLRLVVADVTSDLHRVADQRIPASELDRLFVADMILDAIDGESRSSGERAELLADGIGGDRGEREEGDRTESLNSKIL